MKKLYQLGYFFVAMMLFAAISCSQEDVMEPSRDDSGKDLRTKSDEFDPYAPFAFELAFDETRREFKDIYNKEYFPDSRIGGTIEYDEDNDRYYLYEELPGELFAVYNVYRDRNTSEDQFTHIEFDMEMQFKFQGTYLSWLPKTEFFFCEDDSKGLCWFSIEVRYDSQRREYSYYFCYTGRTWDNYDSYGELSIPMTLISNSELPFGKILTVNLTQRTDQKLKIEISGFSPIRLDLPGYLNPFYMTFGEGMSNIYSFKVYSTNYD